MYLWFIGVIFSFIPTLEEIELEETNVGLAQNKKNTFQQKKIFLLCDFFLKKELSIVHQGAQQSKTEWLNDNEKESQI